MWFWRVRRRRKGTEGGGRGKSERKRKNRIPQHCSVPVGEAGGLGHLLLRNTQTLAVDVGSPPPWKPAGWESSGLLTHREVQFWTTNVCTILQVAPLSESRVFL